MITNREKAIIQKMRAIVVATILLGLFMYAGHIERDHLIDQGIIQVEQVVDVAEEVE